MANAAGARLNISGTTFLNNQAVGGTDGAGDAGGEAIGATDGDDQG